MKSEGPRRASWDLGQPGGAIWADPTVEVWLLSLARD